MKFFIDTANLEQIKEAAHLGILDGVTTNPSLMAVEGVKGKEEIYEHYRSICRIVKGDVSAEVFGTEYDEIIKEGIELAALAPNIVVKVPMIKDGIRAISTFSKQGIRTNCTLVFSSGQAILAAKAGATYVSPFIGRLDDTGWDGMALIAEIVMLYRNFGVETQVLAASIRNPLHITKSFQYGADVVTAPLSAILGLLKHPLTDNGLAKFLADAEKTKL